MNARSFNQAPRNVYIVTDNPCTLVGVENLQIMEIRPEQEEAFLKDYAGRIIAAGSSIQEVLIKYSELLKNA